MFNINLNLEKLNCFFNCKNCCIDEKLIKLTAYEIEQIINTTNCFVFVNILLGKLITLINGKSGFIYKAIDGNVTAYKALSVYGLDVSGKPIFTTNIINIPLYYKGLLVGTLGLGMKSNKIDVDKLQEQIEPIIEILSKYLYTNEFD